MTFDELKQKALSLTLEPGVYIMRDENDKVIYVGKAKKLKNRVSQYFQDTASHTPKTRIMVSHIHHFDVIVAATEFEALVLECSLIKRYMPKYNILLKDGKGYPYLRLSIKDRYPTITLANRPADDGAMYFGPYGSRGVTNDLLQALLLALKLPQCSLKFPRDIGKDRPCLNYHMGQCDGWCQTSRSEEEYRLRIVQAKQLLSGNYRALAEDLNSQMMEAADALNFELAANLRDRKTAVEILGKKQLVTAGSFGDTDVIGFSQTEAKACFAVLHFSKGDLTEKEYEILPATDDPCAALSSLVKQYYLRRGFAPKTVLLPMPIEDADLFSQYLLQEFGRRSVLRVPQRGDNVRLVELACKNAKEEAERCTDKEERTNATVVMLGKMLSMDPPKRLESFDISNISGTDIVASMVVFLDGKPHKSDYRHFKVEGLANQDDYASMNQVVYRRLLHLKAGDKGFDIAPDALLIDGGVNHARVALDAVQSLGFEIPVFGMVKDDRHRTRALVTPQGQEIRIDNNPSVFALIGNIQEQTHNFAISYHRKLRSKRLRYSALDEIPGIGQKRKQLLLKQFKSISAIRSATMDQLLQILPSDAAMSVYKHFHNEG